MMSYSTEAQTALDRYLQQWRAALRGSRKVDAADGAVRPERLLEPGRIDRE